MVFQFLILVQKLQQLSIQDQLLFFAEQNLKFQYEAYQLLNTISEKVNLINLSYSLKFLRVCCRLEKSAFDSVLVMNAKFLNERMLTQLGKSCQCYLKGIAQSNLPTLLMTFIQIVDGSQDKDFDELFALEALGIIFKELASLLILLDPMIAQLVKSNLSVNLKLQLSRPIIPIAKGQIIFKIIETLLQGNSEYFIDFVETINKHLFSNSHSMYKGLAYQTLVNCTNLLVDYLSKDKFYQLYNQIIAQINTDAQPDKLQQIHEVIGHFVSLKNIQYSDNKTILNFIAEFNFRLSQNQIQFQFILQKSIKKCMKNLLTRVEFPLISKTYENFIGILDPDIKNSMMMHLIKNKKIAFVTQLLYSHEVSLLVWETFIREYLLIKENDEAMEAEIMKLILFDCFNELKLVGLLNCQCYQLFIQLYNIQYDSIQFEPLIQILFEKLLSSFNQHIVELICSLLILRIDRSNIFEYNIFLKLIQMNVENELMLHYIQTISSKIEQDQVLSLLTQCQPSQLIYTIINDTILDKELDESDLDLILYIVEKQNLVNDQFYANLMDLIAEKQDYAVALFNLTSQQNIPSKLTFYMASKIANQSYYNADVNQQLKFHFQQNLNYMIDLCQFTYQAAQIDPIFIESQIEYFAELLDTKLQEFIEEITRIIKFYLTNFPDQTCLSRLIPKYLNLYNYQQLPQKFSKIAPDLTEIIEILLKNMTQDAEFTDLLRQFKDKLID